MTVTKSLERTGVGGLLRAHRPLLVGVALATVYLAWGSTYLAIAVMVDEMPTLLSSGTRALAAGVLLAAGLAIWRGSSRLRVTSRQLRGCVVLALLLPVAGQGLVTVAEDRNAPSGLTALLVAGVPLWVTCLRISSGERPPVRSVLGVLLGFVGVAALIVGSSGGDGAPSVSLVLVVLASIAWAAGSWLQPRLTLPEDPFVVVTYELLLGGLVLAVMGLAGGERLHPTAYSGAAWWSWGYLVALGSLAAFTAYTWLLRSVSVSLVATYAYVNPVIAISLGWLLLHEEVTRSTLAAAGVVVGAVALVVGAERGDSR